MKQKPKPKGKEDLVMGWNCDLDRWQRIMKWRKHHHQSWREAKPWIGRSRRHGHRDPHRPHVRRKRCPPPK